MESGTRFKAILPLFSNVKFYIGLLSIIAGGALNFASQTYLHNYMEEGKTLPMLNDMILDNLPVIDLSLVYDLACLVVFAVVAVYIFHKNEQGRLPYILLLCGIFFILRGVFIVLTPFGNPPHFQGSDPLFNGFSKFELGVYPSGHVGNTFLLMLIVKDKVYKHIIAACVLIIVFALLLSHGHYSIDIFSGFFFAYAIRSFGDKYLLDFDISQGKS